MRERDLDGRLRQVFQQSFALNRQQEDTLWSRFAARRAHEAAAWAAFAATMGLLYSRLRPAIRASRWPASLNPRW